MCVLGVGEKIEVWCELESVTGVMEYLGVQWHFFIGLKVLGSGRDENVDTGFLRPCRRSRLVGKVVECLPQ